MVPVGAPRKSRRSSAAEPRSERGAVTIPAHSVGSLRGCQGVASPTGTLPGSDEPYMPSCKPPSSTSPTPFQASRSPLTAAPLHRASVGRSLTETTVSGQPRSHSNLPHPSPTARRPPFFRLTSVLEWTRDHGLRGAIQGPRLQCTAAAAVLAFLRASSMDSPTARATPMRRSPRTSGFPKRRISVPGVARASSSPEYVT